MIPEPAVDPLGRGCAPYPAALISKLLGAFGTARKAQKRSLTRAELGRSPTRGFNVRPSPPRSLNLFVANQCLGSAITAGVKRMGFGWVTAEPWPSQDGRAPNVRLWRQSGRDLLTMSSSGARS